MFRIAVLISGGGSNLQSILDSIDSGYLKCSISCVISDREGAFGIERARVKNIMTYIVDRKIYGNSLSDEILKIVDGKADLIVLAGFLSILKGDILKRFNGRIINIHPSLIPSFSGPGMHGIKVHEAAVNYGVKVSGCTVHFVDEGTDTGPILLQRTVCVNDDDTPESLQKKVLSEEHKALSEAVKLISEGRVTVMGRKVIIGGF